MSPATRVKLALVDDHTLFRKGLISLLEMAMPDHDILFEADNGLDLKTKLDPDNQPDIILMDINMPQMDGFTSVSWLNEHFPLIKVLVISMIENEESIVRMLKLGVKGYLCKDVEPAQLGEALHTIMRKGFFYTDYITGMVIHSLRTDRDSPGKPDVLASLTDRELAFLQLACTELTYQEIADKMFLSPKTIDGYRGALFEKLNAKSRVGLVLFAVKQGLI
jgi:two-component system invasion response regulator UvrY